MASTGVQRCLDDLGRITLPKEIRNNLTIPTGTPLLIHVEGNRIILEKSSTACAICGSVDDVKEFNGKGICHHCIERIKEDMQEY